MRKRDAKAPIKGHRGRSKKGFRRGRKSRGRGPIRVALTGMIASGKTTAMKFFRSKGWATISSDEIVSQIYGDWKLDKEALRKKFLSSATALKAWEKKVHPEVARRYLKWIKRQTRPMMIEIPLLFEVGMNKLFDLSLFVFCPKEERMRRALKRGMSKKLWHFLESRQLPAEKKFLLSDYILHNLTKTGLKKQIAALSKALK